MSKVTVGLGLTIQLSEAGREFAKPYVEIQEIDTEGDIDAQIESASSTIIKVWDAETRLLYGKITEMTDDDRIDLSNALAQKVHVVEEGLVEVKKYLKDIKKGGK